MFEHYYEAWLKQHEEQRKGESRRRLKEGHSHAEKSFIQEVWWPAVGSLEHLHPEYEIADFRDGTRYLDFAYLRPPHKVCFEIDGYGPHSREVSRWQFADQLTRQNHLQLDGWKIIRFSYDEVKEKPRRCQQMIQQILGRWYGTEQINLPLKQREIVKQAMRYKQPFCAKDVCGWLEVKPEHARILLHGLANDGILEPVSGVKRITRYILGATIGASIYH
ncbi:MAG: DNA-binding response regulator [Gorillibacterium sp.]|nr:DNA-binding response regulator [Gorillibacterium sp.]